MECSERTVHRLAPMLREGIPEPEGQNTRTEGHPLTPIGGAASLHIVAC